MVSTEVCESLFTALSAGDFETVRYLCSPELHASQNNGPAMNLETLLDFTAAVLGVVEHFRYENAIRSGTESGFVEEHLVRGTLPDGSELNLAACVVGEIQDGKVTYLREYVDSAQASGLIKALS